MIPPVDHPLHVDRRGGTARTTPSDHVRDLVEQVLFTGPGERVNRPDFGAGVAQLLFAPASPEVAATTQLLIQGALQQWLGDVIDVGAVEVQAVESTITVTVAYTERRTQASDVVRFTAPGGGA